MKAGLDLQMPGPATHDINKLIKAVQNGALDQKVLDQSVTKMLELIFRHIDNKHDATFDRDAHHKLSREICEETVVLMKNEENILPLKKEQKVAFIGEYAEKPRFQGGGSSYINTSQLPSALDAAKEFGVIVQYARAFSSEKDEATEEEIAAAVELAKSVDVAVVFAGLPEDYETEGLDRQHINMPSVQNRVIAEVSKANPNTVVVLHNGGVVLMPWLDGVKGLVELYLGGQAVGQVTVDVLYGKVNPSGHLTESWPKRVEDNPAWLDFPGHSDKVFYLESIFVGYRYYDAKSMEVVFPFGHGLSYTTFEYSNLRVSKEEFNDNEEIEVTVDIKNTGAVAGRAVAQLYVSDKTNAALRPPKELKGFGKVLLQPGETKSVTMKLNKRSFAWYNPEIKDWYCETGNYDILIGESSRKIHLTKTVKVTSTANIIKFVTINTTYMDMLRNPITAPLIQQMLDENPTQKAIMESDNPDNEFYRICVRGAPVRALILFFPFDGDYIDNLIERANKLIKESLEK
ncbi:beta-glucosidase-related glycosidase [Tritrichomonas foetus]|uniref:beta-glucosidase n=1 Tax=Tritrichomonas foetus TaxID=1144522 RepID=A0A1J4KUT7_9EUKA|nr:beta-glucosidase-related glycosidase [Tritrichomonas foetus]|eukprot:OHT15051.1 beta-glucosidase-related glycosidase [Tritrichomonas foetus]